jgi:hypothetical protein
MMSNVAFDRSRFRFNNIFYGWWIALVLAVLSTYGNGIYYYGFSTFVKPIVNELTWSMTVVSGAFSI